MHTSFLANNLYTYHRLELESKSGEVDKIFVKVPAPSIFERMFLTIFGVYRNELNFYATIHSLPHAPRHLYCEPLVASMIGTRFVLCLRDLGAQGCTFPSITGTYTPEQCKVVLASCAQMHAAFWGRPPAGCWTDEWSAPQTDPPTRERTRPRWLRLIAETTLKKFIKRLPGRLPPDVVRTYKRFILHFHTVRRYWSTAGTLTMVHGDCHAGNMFFRPDGSSGFLDMQCVAAEHCMRDVAYHMSSVFTPHVLEAREDELIAHYLEHLNARLAERGIAPLNSEEAHFQYRLHTLWALAAFVISAGASELMEEGVAGSVIPNICAAVQRLDAAGALEHVLQEAGVTA